MKRLGHPRALHLALVGRARGRDQQVLHARTARPLPGRSPAGDWGVRSARGGMDDPPGNESRELVAFARAPAEALLGGDEGAAEAAIRDALDANLSVAEI